MTDQTFSLVQLSTTPPYHRQIASSPSASIVHLLQGIAGPPALDLKLMPILGLPLPGTTLPAIYLSYQQPKDGDPSLVAASTVSMVDWRTGKQLAQARLPLTGLIDPLDLSDHNGNIPGVALLDRGFYLTLGTGGAHMTSLYEATTTSLLVVTLH